MVDALAQQRYETVAEISRSERARIWRVDDHETGRELALKRIRLPEDRRAERLEWFQLRLDQLRATKEIGLPEIVDFGVWSEAELFLTTAWVDGTQLEELGPQSTAIGLFYATQVADCLARLAESRQALLTLSPANVLVRDDGQVRLLGLGTGYCLPEATRRRRAHVVNPYRAPEAGNLAALKHPELWRADLFSVSALICSQLSAVVRGAAGPVPVVELPMDLSSLPTGAELESVLRDGLRLDPLRRPNDYGELIQILERTLGELAAAGRSTSSDRTVVRQTPRAPDLEPTGSSEDALASLRDMWSEGLSDVDLHTGRETIRAASTPRRDGRRSVTDTQPTPRIERPAAVLERIKSSSVSGEDEVGVAGQPSRRRRLSRLLFDPVFRGAANPRPSVVELDFEPPPELPLVDPLTEEVPAELSAAVEAISDPGMSTPLFSEPAPEGGSTAEAAAEAEPPQSASTDLRAADAVPPEEEPVDEDAPATPEVEALVDENAQAADQETEAADEVWDRQGSASEEPAAATQSWHEAASTSDPDGLGRETETVAEGTVGDAEVVDPQEDARPGRRLQPWMIAVLVVAALLLWFFLRPFTSEPPRDFGEVVHLPADQAAEEAAPTGADAPPLLAELPASVTRDLGVGALDTRSLPEASVSAAAADPSPPVEESGSASTAPDPPREPKPTPLPPAVAQPVDATTPSASSSGETNLEPPAVLPSSTSNAGGAAAQGSDPGTRTRSDTPTPRPPATTSGGGARAVAAGRRSDRSAVPTIPPAEPQRTLNEVAAPVRTAFERGDLDSALRARRALSTAERRRLDSAPSTRALVSFLELAEQQVELFEAALAEGRPVEAMERANRLHASFPAIASGRTARERAEAAARLHLERHLELGETEQALVDLQRIRAEAAEPDFMSDLVARAEGLELAARAEQASVEAEQFLRRAQPHLGLALLPLVAEQEPRAAAALEARLRGRLEELDRQPPHIELDPFREVEFRRNRELEIRLRAEDDYEVVAISFRLVTDEQSKPYKELPVQHVGGRVYRVVIDPRLHDNSRVAFWAEAYDRSGNVAQLGSPDKPIRIRPR